MVDTAQKEILTKSQDIYVPFLKLLIPFVEKNKIATPGNLNKLKAMYRIFTTSPPAEQSKTFLDNKMKLEAWYKKAGKKKRSCGISNNELSQEESISNTEDFMQDFHANDHVDLLSLDTSVESFDSDSKFCLMSTTPPTSSVVEIHCSMCKNMENRLIAIETELTSIKNLIMDVKSTANDVLMPVDNPKQQLNPQKLKNFKQLDTHETLCASNERLKDPEVFSKMKMNIDPRGVKRGVCQTNNCDCSSYEFDDNNGAKYNYCFCPPTKHRAIEVSKEKTDGNLLGAAALIEVSTNNGNLQLQGGNFTLQDVTVQIVPSTSSLCSPEDFLPKKLPKQVEVALETNSLTPQLRNRIVRVIADKCFQENLQARDVDNVADMAVKKWSPLKSRFGDSPSGSLSVQIKRRMSKLRLHSKKTGLNEDISDLVAAEANTYNKRQMTLEVEKANSSIVNLKQFLDSTRPKQEVNTTNA